MEIEAKISTGIPGFDETIDSLRLGDNVVWQVDHINAYKDIITPFVNKALNEKRRVVYVRFGQHQSLVNQKEVIQYNVDAKKGFESFATEIHRLIEREGVKTFYVFDSLTDLLSNWCSDLMIGNFFKLSYTNWILLPTLQLIEMFTRIAQ